MTLGSDPAGQPQVLLHDQRLQLAVVRQPTERLLVRRVITAETRQIEVTVRREELRVERVPVEEQPSHPPTGGTAMTTRAATTRARTRRPPLIVVLSQEVPTVQLHTEPYERVTLHIDTITDQQQVTASLEREEAAVSTTSTSPFGQPEPVDP